VTKLQNGETWRFDLRLPMTAGLLAGALLFLMPLAWVEQSAAAPEEADLLPASPVPVAESAAVTTARDENATVRVLLDDGTVDTQTMADYLWSVTAAEMPATFEPDALRAQAVCARTYTAWRAEHTGKHQDADVCTDSSCCQAYTTREDAAERWGSQAEEYAAKITTAVADTDGVIAAYDGEPIQAVFFSSSSGATEDAAAVWGSSLPYLVSVESPEGDDVPNYRSQVTLTPEEVRTIVLAAYPGADLSGSPSGWFTNVTYTASGRVATIDVGGVTLSGGGARNLFSLRSACFQVDADQTQVTFSVTGYGHGVGLSQYGANAMARSGSTWQEIISHYYTGVTLDTL
jgi:stage II sporulation protein D